MNKLAIIAPGWSSPNMFFSPAKKWMEGYDVFHLTYIHRGFTSLDKLTKSLSRPLKAMVADYDFSVIVGHSMGGLVATKLFNDYNLPVDAIVSIASPHKGTKIAPNWFPGTIGEMAYQKDLEYQPDIPHLQIRAQFDPLLWPNNFGGQKNNTRTIPMTEHISVYYSPRTWAEIYSWCNYEVL